MVNANSIEHFPGCDLKHRRRQRCSTWVAVPTSTAPTAATSEGGPMASRSVRRNLPLRDASLRIDGWTGTSTLWQLGGLLLAVVSSIGIVLALWLDNQNGLGEWLGVPSVLVFVYGWFLLSFPGLLFVWILPVPALRGDRTAAIGIAACVTNLILTSIVWNWLLSSV